MHQEPYQGFSIQVLDPVVTGALGREVGCSVIVLDEGDAQVFSVSVQVAYTLSALLQTKPEELASKFAIRWAHGLIDTDGYEEGSEYEELRLENWEQAFADTVVSDLDIRVEVLRAARRMSRVSGRVGPVPWLDVEGLADVMGVSASRVRGEISLMGSEDLLAPRASTLGRPFLNGALQVTAKGLEWLRDAEARAPEETQLIRVDEIESFLGVRAVSAVDVRDCFGENGLLALSEETVKTAFLEILGEPFEFKDWGGERSDVFTTHVIWRGRRAATAFLLKGPSVGSVLFPSGLGKRADQDLRLFTEPAELFILQFNGKIDSSVVKKILLLLEHEHRSGNPVSACIIDGVDTARVLRAYGKL